MSRRPRVLFVSNRLPIPLNNGTSIRINNVLAAIAAVSEVHWISYGSKDEMNAFRERSGTLPWWERCATMRALPRPFWIAEDEKQFERFLRIRPFSQKSLFLTTFPADPLRQMAHRFYPYVDMVWIERLEIAHQLELPREKCIVDIDDMESVKIFRKSEITTSAYSKWRLRHEASLIRAFENSAPNRYGKLVVCSETDAEKWPFARSDIWVVPNGADDSLFLIPNQRRIPNRLIFVGLLGYWPNTDAILFFTREIFPLIEKEIPSVSLSIVGRSPPESIKALHDGKKILVHSDVPDVSPYIKESVASIVPLRAGGGTRLKILESIALGTPVVSTTIGAEGLNLKSGRDYLIADHPAEFAAAVLCILRNPDEREKMITQGYNSVDDQYRWSKIRNRLGTAVLEHFKCIQGRDTEPVAGLFGH